MNYSHNIPDNVDIDFMIGAYRVISRKHAEESNKVIDDETLLRCATLKHHMDGIYKAMLNKIPESHLKLINKLMSEAQMNAAREEVERQEREHDELVARQIAEIQKRNREEDMFYKFIKICLAIAGSAIAGMILTLLFCK